MPAHGPAEIPLSALEPLLRTRLRPLDAFDLLEAPARSDFDLNPTAKPPGGVLAPAAVLVGFASGPAGARILLTRRSDALRRHSGQVALPGGRLEAGEGPVAAALRESFEEVGLDPSFVEPVGLGDAYETGTGFSITPVVGLLRPGFALRPDPREVAEIFEVAAGPLMDPSAWELRTVRREGEERTFYAQEHDGRFIWGATAGVLRALAERLQAGG